MEILKNVPLIIVLGTATITEAQTNFMSMSPALLQRSSHICQEITREPYFTAAMVTGKPWRIYHTWNMRLESACVDAHFISATPEIVQRIYYDMYHALIEQPLWELATLLMITGKNRREVLLIPDAEIPGRFLAVNNDASDFSRKQISLLRLQLKLLRHGKYLFFMDCQVGIAWLGLRFDEMLFRIDIESVVSEVIQYLGEGHQACTNETNPIEMAVTPEMAHKRQRFIQ